MASDVQTLSEKKLPNVKVPQNPTHETTNGPASALAVTMPSPLGMRARDASL